MASISLNKAGLMFVVCLASCTSNKASTYIRGNVSRVNEIRYLCASIVRNYASDIEQSVERYDDSSDEEQVGATLGAMIAAKHALSSGVENCSFGNKKSHDFELDQQK